MAPLEAGAGARATFHPRGVLAVLSPFNFPVHLANGHLVPALALGNTVVLKPSDLAPAAGEWLVRALRDASVPPGVVEIVHGGAETGRALATHPDVDGVLFTGSWSVGRALARAMGAPEELVTKVPTADLETLAPLRPDEEAFGVTYGEIDDYLEGKPVSPRAAFASSTLRPTNRSPSYE